MGRMTSRIMTSDQLSIGTDLIPVVDLTITRYGYYQLVESLRMDRVMDNYDQLMDHQEFIRQLINSPQRVNQLSQLLHLIHEREPDVEWLEADMDEQTKRFYPPVGFLNHPKILYGYNQLMVYGFTLTLVLHLINMLVLKLYVGVPNTMAEYVDKTISQLRRFAEGGVGMVIRNRRVVSLVGMVLVNSYIIFQLFQLGTGFFAAWNHRIGMGMFRDRYRRLKQLINLIGKLRSVIDINHQISDQFYVLRKYINQSTSFGQELISRTNQHLFRDSLRDCLQFIGEVDLLVNSARLVLYHDYSIPEFVQSDTPALKITDLYHPKLSIDSVTNDVEFHPDERVMVITGGNGAGKSTLMRSVMISTIMAQTMGVVPAKRMRLTPFTHLSVYLNIPDAVGKQSLYEAELDNCLDHLNCVQRLPSHRFGLSIIDELFTGTNPVDGISGSIAVVESLGGCKNCYHIVSTHFHQLCELGRKKSTFVNKQFRIEYGSDGRIIPNYRLCNGVSDQNIGVSLMKQRGFSQQVVEQAEKVAQRIRIDYTGSET